MNEEWVETTLGEVATWGAGGTPKAGDPRYYDGGTIPWAVIADVQDDYISITEKSITEEGLRTIGHHAPEGSVLVTMYGTIGRVAITAMPMATNQAIAWGIPNLDLTSPEFLFFWLRSYQPQLDRMARGATQRNINRAIIKDTSILLPPIPVQRRIVDLMTHLDSHLANLRAERAKAVDLVAALRNHVFRDSGLDSRTLGDVLCLIIDNRGKTPGKLGSEFVSAGAPVLSAVNVKNGFIVDSVEPRFVDSDTYQRWMKTPTIAGDVLLTSEGPLGQVAQVPDDQPWVLGQRLFGLRGREGELLNDYLLHFLSGEFGQNALISRSSGSTVRGIRQSELAKILIPLSSIPEQENVCALMNSAVATLRKLEREIQTLERARKSILDPLLNQSFKMSVVYDSLLAEVA